METSAIPSPPRRPRIAVVAVHGVATHQPDESAKAVVEMLAGLNDANARHYTPFEDSPLLIPTHPVPADPNYKVDSSDLNLDYNWMYKQLKDYDEHGTYETKYYK